MTQEKKKPLTKKQVIANVAEKTGYTQPDVEIILDGLVNSIRDQLQEAGVVTLYELMRITKIEKPAKPARQGINPFTKEPMTFKEKPASNVLKIKPLKLLKDMV